MAALKPGDLVSVALRRRIIRGVRNGDRGEVLALHPGQLYPYDVRFPSGFVARFDRLELDLVPPDAKEQQ